MKKICCLIVLFIAFSAKSQSVTVLTDLSLQTMLESISDNFDCCNITNIVTTNNADLHNQGFKSFGSFIFTNEPNFPLTEGLMMSTGDATSLGNLPTGNSNWPGDSDLENIYAGSVSTFNATLIEFDFVPYQQEFSMDYVFASMEYDSADFICTFPDTFAFIVSGPGIPNSNNYDHDANPNTPEVLVDLGGINIATINGTNIPVNPTNVHNQLDDCLPGSLGEFAVDTAYDAVNSGNNITNFKGQTIPLTAQINLIPGLTYHMKLVISDSVDAIFDSAVFLKDQSMSFGFVPNNLPLFETFGTAELPNCWMTSETANFSLSNTCSPTNENYLQLFGGDYHIDSAPVEADLFNAIEVSWSILAGCVDMPDNNEDLVLEYFDGLDWHIFDTVSSPSIQSFQNNWEDKSYFFTEGLNKNFKIRFTRNGGQDNQDDYNIADFQITSASNCPFPSALTVDGVNTTNATLSWIFPENFYGSYDYVLVNENDDPVTGQILASGQISKDTGSLFFDQLTGDTNYDFYIISPCDGTSLLFSFSTSTLSNHQFDSSKIRIYPNPVKDVLKLSSNYEINRIDVFDINGKQVFTESLHQNEINMEFLENGIYLMKLYTKDGNIGVKKFIKN